MWALELSLSGICYECEVCLFCFFKDTLENVYNLFDRNADLVLLLVEFAFVYNDLLLENVTQSTRASMATPRACSRRRENGAHTQTPTPVLGYIQSK